MLLLSTINSYCQIQEISIEYPVFINGKLSEFNLLYQSDSSVLISTELLIYKTNKLIDSSLYKTINLKNISLRKGVGKYNLKSEWDKQLDRKTRSILAFTNNLPPGEYVSILKIDSRSESYTNHWKVDSQLNTSAKINTLITDEIQKNLKKVKGSKNKLSSLVADAKKGKFKALKKQNKIESNTQKSVLKSLNKKIPGLDIKTEINGNKQKLSFYYEKEYLGYKEIDIKKEIKDYARGKLDKVKDNATNTLKDNLSDYRTLFEQYKEKKAEKMKKDGVEGSISLDNYFDSDQEEFSPNNNIYSEVYTQTKLKLLGIPFQLEGFYTTQDRNRNIKASYLRLQYDIQSSKDELEENIQQFKNDYSSKKSNLFAKKSIYGNYINKLKGSKTNLLNGLKQEINLKELSDYNWEDLTKNPHLFDNIDTAKLVKQLLAKAETRLDSNGKVEKNKQKILDKKAKAEERVAKVKKKIEQLKVIEEKVRKYAAMIQQMQKTMHFDSAFVMGKLNKESGMEDYSKNSLLKKSKELLPRNDFSKFTKGLKGLNIGILNQYESDYSMAGQTMRGGGIEYTIKGVDVGVSVGQTEYISRDLTNLDTYNNLMAKATYELNDKHRVKFVYFTYKPSNKLKANTFFSSLRNNQLSFNNPTNITNIIYKGAIAKSIDYRVEVAGSYQKTTDDAESEPTMKQLAYKGELAYTPSKFPLGFNLEYEKVGKDFTNETLAFLRRNFETKKITTFGEFFKGYLRAKVSFQELTQNPGEEQLRKNTRWGFDLRTVSKRYPNLQLSYKPFTTFSSVYDTFAVAQRNLFGEAVRGKLSYQLKRNGYSHRWNAVFNRNRTNVDTVDYQTDIIQAGYTLNTKGNMYMLQFGKMKMPATFSETTNTENYFVRGNEQFKLSNKLPIQFGQEIAWFNNNINRFGVQVGTSYKLKNKPLSIRLQFRYLTYRNTENLMQNIYGTMLGLTYDFRIKKK